MLPHQTVLVLLMSLAAFTSAVPLPALPLPQAMAQRERGIALAQRDITINHVSSTTGVVTTHEVDSALLHPDLVEALEGNDVNISVITERKQKRRHTSTPQSITRRAVLAVKAKRSGIFNSTINATIISKKDTVALPEDDATHHNVHIDASSTLGAEGGGIADSVININFNTRRSPVNNVGDHSVLLDLSSTSDDGKGLGIEESTVHVNILPVRADKTVGDNSILIDSSSSSPADTSTAGDHSAVVDTSASTGIKSSTVNLTIVSPKNEAVSEEPSEKRSSESAGLERREPALGKRRMD